MSCILEVVRRSGGSHADDILALAHAHAVEGEVVGFDGWRGAQ